MGGEEARTAAPSWTGRASGWLRGTRGGLLLIAALLGAGAGLGAVAFRYLVYGFTWLATGHTEFGQQGYVGSRHFPWLGLGFFVVIPVVGGIIYGPLIYRYAREARGHGVPEVMIAVAENGGRIRPQVSAVKAVASALCIGVGGSVGREGPIVQIGSALASSVGQWIKMPENRLRILVACGAAGGISATFNAPMKVAEDGQQIAGWVTGTGALAAVARQVQGGETGAPEAQLSAGGARPDAASALREPPTPLDGYRVVEITIGDASPGAGQVLGAITWPAGWTPVSVLQDRRLGSPDPGITLAAGDRINVLAPVADPRDQPGPT